MHHIYLNHVRCRPLEYQPGPEKGVSMVAFRILLIKNWCWENDKTK